MEGVSLHDFPLLFLCLLPGRLSEQTISLEEIEVFLQFPALWLIKCKLLLRRGDVSFLEVDGIDVIDSDDCKEEDTDVLGIYLVFFQSLVGLVDQRALQIVLSFFFNPNEPHFLEDFIEEDILYLGLR